jgi:hypothetical protein
VRGIRWAGPLVAIFLVVGCSAVAGYPIVATTPSASCGYNSHKGLYMGVMAPGFPSSTVNLDRFESATGIHPSLVTYYSGFGIPFDVSAACYVRRQGATPVVQIEPLATSLAYIADGKYDSYLRMYAVKVRAFGAEVVISFAPEMNGSRSRISASLFGAAWRHIVDVFRSEGAKNVTWMWTIEALSSSNAASPRPWWPGGNYVTWVGIDAYYRRRSQTFNSLVNSTVSAVRHISHDPVLLAEIGVARAAGNGAKIINLFAGIHSHGFLGFVWFDADRKPKFDLGIGPVAAAAFRHEARSFS